ncbi:MAG: hypothetical protein FD143_811 [Ignavibacteria bacterium]|nr:MAG: hypothetical protein FD143_811 [Ignavibacteria bacterium]KAF0160603.1 MAG: hypothetical protein FD188_1595 [Ignavibacteria bacterium]
MSTKTKNTIIIAVILIVIVLSAGVYDFIFQKNKIEEKEQQIKELTQYQYDTKVLESQLASMKVKIGQLDSILANRKYAIPVNISQANFFEFVNKVSYSFSSDSYVNIEYVDMETFPNFNIYNYNIFGIARYADFYRLIYGIEESKNLKKVVNVELSSNVKVDEEGIPVYLVNYKFNAKVYFSSDDRFSFKGGTENSLVPNQAYDIFYPLVRNEIPPNINALLDVQSAQLLALIPDGAFLSDASGNTYLLWEGDKIYLGYLTNIDYLNNRVNFVLNKGGVIENVSLQLQKEKKENKTGK